MVAISVTSSRRTSILAASPAAAAASSSFVRRPRSRMEATTLYPAFASSTEASNPKPLDDPVMTAILSDMIFPVARTFLFALFLEREGGQTYPRYVTPLHLDCP